MRRTLLWAAILAALLGGAARWLWLDVLSRRDEFLAAAIREKIREFAPGWRIEFERAEWQTEGRIEISHVKLGTYHQQAPFIRAPEVILHLDTDLLAEGFQGFIAHVEIHRPQVDLVRHSEGNWNWEELPRLPDGDVPLPQIDIHDGTITIRLEASHDLPLSEFELRSIGIEIAGDSYHRYQLRGTSAADSAGAVEFEGSLNIENWAWSISGRCRELQSPDALLELAASLSQETRARFQDLAEQTAVAREHSGSSPANEQIIRPVSRTRESGSASECSIPALGIAAELQLAFQVARESSEGPLQYQLGARLQNGVIDNPALPVPLENLSGEIFLDNTQLVLKALQASSGDRHLFLDGQVSRDPSRPAQRFTFRAHNLEFGREIQQHLWGGLLRFYESLRPAGRFNIDIAAETDGVNGWQINLNEFEVFGCSVLPEAFPYPAHQMSGRIRQTNDWFQLEFTGLAGDQPITARGEFSNPGPELQARIEIRVANFPIDARFRQALETEQLRGVSEAVERLNLWGLADTDVLLTRAGAGENAWKVGVDARIRNATVRCDQFPYAVHDLSLQIRHDPLAVDEGRRDVWQLIGIDGRHGTARISGAGAFAARGPRQLLDLELTALEIPIDRELEFACVSASPLLREAFDSIGRTGQVDLERIRILWAPLGSPIVVLPSIIVRDASVRLEQWPYAWERVTGTMSWEHRRLTIAQLTAWHGAETYLQVDNQGEPTAAVLEFPESGDTAWHLHLENVQVRRIVPDATFRQALNPAGLGPIIDQLDPRGPLNLQLGLDLKGGRTSPQQVTAAWTLEASLLGNSLTTGVELQDMSGRVSIERGIWDGRSNFIDGHFRLETVNLFGFPVTAVEGPFLVDGQDIYVGTPTWPEAGRPPAYDLENNPQAGQQARGEIYKGKLGFDVHARLSAADPEQTTYRASVTLRDALLEELARDRSVAADRLKGPVNGRLDLYGRGTSDRNIRGSGWVQVSPAQLYELPVLNRMLASLELRQPDTTAFRYAYGQFTLHDGLVDFSEIQLLGESLLLVGRGSVAFGTGLNQQLAIEFLRSKFRNRIPIIGQAISAVTSNSIGVRVGGTLSSPIVDVQPKLGLVDDTMRKLIEGFENGQTPRPPRIMPLIGPPGPRGPGR